MNKVLETIKEALNLQNKRKKKLTDKNDKLLKSFIDNNREEEYQEHVNRIK